MVDNNNQLHVKEEEGEEEGNRVKQRLDSSTTCCQ